MRGKEAIKETISLYKISGWKKWFVKIRFWDAPFLEVERLVPKEGKIVDLGCGEGLFTNLLALSSSQSQIIGIEIDENRIRQADHGIRNVRFEKGDVTNIKIPRADCIIMFHLLHHLNSFEAQEKLIKKCAEALKKNGRLIIVEVAEQPILKHALSWLTDAFVVPILFEKKLFNMSFFYRTEKGWKELFTKYRLRVQTKQAHKGKPFSHVIFIAQK